MLVILPVSIIEGTGFCESLGKNYNIIACSLGSSPSCSLLSDSSCQHPSSAQRPCRWAPESLQGLGASVTPSPPNFMVREEHLQAPGARGNPSAIPKHPSEGPRLCCASQGTLASGKGHLPQQGRKKMDMYLCNFFLDRLVKIL